MRYNNPPNPPFEGGLSPQPLFERGAPKPPPSKGGLRGLKWVKEKEECMFIKTKKFISYNSELNSRAKTLRQNLTGAEKKLWFEYLRGYKYRFVRQKVIGNYIVDFYCQKLKLGIEVDGETHLGGKNEQYDKVRTNELMRYGIKIVRFWNNDIFYGMGEVQRIIEEEIKRREIL